MFRNNGTMSTRVRDVSIARLCDACPRPVVSRSPCTRPRRSGDVKPSVATPERETRGATISPPVIVE